MKRRTSPSTIWVSPTHFDSIPFAVAPVAAKGYDTIGGNVPA
jgi:hypothetical protein